MNGGSSAGLRYTGPGRRPCRDLSGAPRASGPSGWRPRVGRSGALAFCVARSHRSDAHFVVSAGVMPLNSGNANATLRSFGPTRARAAARFRESPLHATAQFPVCAVPPLR